MHHLIPEKTASMTKNFIYLDESGDLGWKFDLPYRRGGSSRHLTIASLIIDEHKRHLPKRLIKKLYQKFNWPTSEEKKWSMMNALERSAFAEAAKQLANAHPGVIRYSSITVFKANVQAHIRADENKLYNYMIGLSLLAEMGATDEVEFVPDPRSIKVESGNSLHDYLQTKLWFDCQKTTVLLTRPCDSSCSTNVQFSDMLSGIVQSHFEDGNSAAWAILKSHISVKTLYFP
ncbi:MULTISPECIES: DUF3800 domain-containing protein [Pseudomonas]|uniref:DUF3800 domain-containing protein n=1 Tax=Pseudomonas TaxID=286 RepID=UPI001AE8EAA5|nr:MULTISPECIES: DUF3800 domain-containing protein [unclassified Pseudomonas]MBP1127953.1 hypothetical protein [Pseudomonas sp. PvP025]MDQ0396891.1 hypothetical protein [Pseudomonas sp. PvP006]